MEVTVQTVSEVVREVEITASAEDLAPHISKAYADYRKKIEIRGFRKGKAPLEVIKKLYGDMIENDSLNEIASELYRKVVQEKELKPIGEPILVDMDYKSGETFRCKIRYDIRPQITVKDYKGITVEKVVHTVTDADVENELLRLRRMNAAMEDATEVTDSEFIVTVTLQDLDDNGTPVAGKRSENVRFYLADEQLEQPFKDALHAATVGGRYEVRFEHMHGEEKHSVNTQIDVQKIQKVVLPALDDAFVVKATKDKFTTVDALRANIKTELIAYWKERSDRQVINSLSAEIIKRHEFQVPESLIRSVVDGLLEETKNEYPGKQLPADFDAEKFKEENRPYAIYQAKWALLREELIAAEKITVSDSDLETLAETEAEKIKIPKDRLMSFYKSSEQIKDRLVGDKLLKMLVDASKITEVPEPV